jgi:AcrR family transcriptional regulator
MYETSIDKGGKVGSELKPRKIPAQKRAEKTVKLILDTSSDLLEEVGLDNFNTNLLAERAEIRIATVYRYFPNKLAILSALIERWLELIMERTTIVTELSDPDNDWREIYENFIDIYVDIVLSHKGHLAIRRAVQAAPELARVEARIIRKISIGIFNALEARGIQHSNHQMYNFIEVSLTTIAQAIDMAVIKAKKRKEFLPEIVAETKLQQLSYLANYLD